MNDSKSKKQNSNADYFIDITSEVCPLTFVKTKLLIERMEAGQTAEVRLMGREPLDNVPRSIEANGHEVLELVAEDASASADAVHRLVLRKN